MQIKQSEEVTYGSFVQDENVARCQQRSGQRHELSLALAQIRPILGDFGIELPRH